MGSVRRSRTRLNRSDLEVSDGVSLQVDQVGSGLLGSSGSHRMLVLSFSGVRGYAEARAMSRGEGRVRRGWQRVTAAPMWGLLPSLGCWLTESILEPSSLSFIAEAQLLLPRSDRG